MCSSRWCSVRPKEEKARSRKCIGRQLIKVPPALIYDCMVTAGTGIEVCKNSEEQLKILAACHHDPTAGHMGLKRTVKRITERYKWNGIVKDVQEVVR